MRKHWKLTVMGMWLSLLLAACGEAAPSTDLTVTMTDFAYDPANFIVPAGQPITITATNTGTVNHEFVIFNFGTDAGENFGPEDQKNIYWEFEVDPGSTVTQMFTAPSEPGDYYVTCGISGHLQAGMVATLTVIAP